MIERILGEIREQKISVTGWSLGFIGILFIRFILESLSSPTSSGIIPSDPFTLIHYGLFFFAVSMVTILALGALIKNYVEAAKILLFGLPLIWLAPLLDIVISQGDGFKMLYVFDTGKKLFIDFLTFFGPSLHYGVTYGMRVGILLSLLGIGWYIFYKTKSRIRAIGGVVLIYILVFIIGSLPGTIYTVTQGGVNVSNSTVVEYFQNIILTSNISHNTLHDGIISVDTGRFVELGFNKLLSQILFLFGVVLTGFYFWKISRGKFLSVMRNARSERLNFYIASLFCGAGFAYINDLGNNFVWVDVFGFFSLALAWVALWMHAVHVNDLCDEAIDKISNQNRPLIKNELTHEEMREIGWLWLAIALLGSWVASFYAFFMALVYIAASYIYSVPPLRLRRFPIISSFLISIASLATILSGFFFVSTQKNIGAFPILLGVGVLIMVTLAINFKDIKDMEGDKANGILTFPVLFGERGIKIVAFLFSLAILLSPVFLSFYLFYIVAIPCALIAYKILTKKPYREKPIFVLRFVFIGILGISYIALYWLAKVNPPQ